MPSDKQDKPVVIATPPTESKSAPYEYQQDDARSFSLQFSPMTGEKEPITPLGCELKVF